MVSFSLLNNVLKEYDEMKDRNQRLKDLNSSSKQSNLKTLLLFSLKCRKNTESENPKASRTKNGKIRLLSKYVVHDNKKSKFIKKHEASQLSSSLGIKKPLRKNSFSRSSFVLEVLTI